MWTNDLFLLWPNNLFLLLKLFKVLAAEKPGKKRCYLGDTFGVGGSELNEARLFYKTAAHNSTLYPLMIPTAPTASNSITKKNRQAH